MFDNSNYNTDSTCNSISYLSVIQMSANTLNFEVRILNFDLGYRHLSILLRPLQTSVISFYVF